ncbi:MAG: hypothetical protein U0528_13395 [Anaerolineae bacterium]
MSAIDVEHGAALSPDRRTTAVGIANELIQFIDADSGAEDCSLYYNRKQV